MPRPSVHVRGRASRLRPAGGGHYPSGRRRAIMAGARSPIPFHGRPTMSTTPTPTFDPVAYKTTTRAQWEQAADAWHRWAPTLEAWLGPATELMLDLAAVTTGARVLDVAAGAGGQTPAAGRPGGPGGGGPAPPTSPPHLAGAKSRGER